MKLYIKQKVFSWGDKFNVMDERGESLYTVEGEMFTLGRKLHIYNAMHDEVAFVHQKAMALKPRFFVTVDGQEVAEIVREISILHAHYTVQGPEWEVKGDLTGHDYQIVPKDGGQTVATLHWKWMSWGDSYEIDIARESDVLTALAVVLAIDVVQAQIESASQNTAN